MILVHHDTASDYTWQPFVKGNHNYNVAHDKNKAKTSPYHQQMIDKFYFYTYRDAPSAQKGPITPK